jgi:hypothetical protein
MRSKRVFSFRADQPLSNTRDYYCRFSFIEETYDSADDARNRLANLHLKSPDGPAEESDYLSVMRTGFRVRNVTYVLQTDASVFWDEVQRFSRELESATQGAELSALIDATAEQALAAHSLVSGLSRQLRGRAAEPQR